MPISAYHTPGIYIEEVPAGPQPITAVGTSTAAFVGRAPRADVLVDSPQACNNWSEFMRRYVAEGQSTSTPLSNAVYGFFLNGGGRCFVVNTGDDDSITKALGALQTEDEVAIVAAPGRYDPASYQAILAHCELLKDRVGILDTPEDVDDIGKLTEVGTVEAPAPAPPKPRGQASGGEAAGAAAGGGEGGGGEKPKLGPEGGPKPGAIGPPMSPLGYVSCYFPWLTVMDPLTDTLVNVPPSGHVAGIWARTDMTRGVHVAPAGMDANVRGALNLTYRLTREEQGVLNDVGINCLRLFARAGIVVWGARTRGEAEWRYLNVRRLFNMVEESIEEGTNWIVFESNDETTRKHVRRDIGAFLMRVWRDGALQGATPEEAFFVKCDDETNPPEVVDAGQLVALVGMAPVKPAEFVIFRVMQQTPGAEVTAAASAA